MMEPESPETPFRIIYSRFPSAKILCIYDNACKLHEYAMNREPYFFKDFVTFVDRLHFFGHVGCSIGHNIDTFQIFKCFNSQICEQGNSSTKNFQTQCSFMLVQNFSIYMRLICTTWNRKKLENITSDNFIEKFKEVNISLNVIQKDLFNEDISVHCDCIICKSIKS